jgi:hypothetical protein
MLRRSWLRNSRIALRIERTRHLRILAHLLGQRLQELVERGAQLVHQALEFLVAGAAFERLAQGPPAPRARALGLRNVAVLDQHRHRPQPPHHVAQRVVVLGAGESCQ